MAPEESVPKSSGPPWLEIVERVGKIASLVAIPIVIPLALASYSAKVQENAQKETINRDYVQLAVSILKEKKDESNTQLRDSAVDLLTEHSPTKFAPNVVAALKAGTVSLPQFSGTAHESTRAVPPNGQLVATSDGRSYSVWDVTKGRLLTIADTVTTVTALEFSPDSALLAVGFSDGVLVLSSIASTHQPTTRIKIQAPVSAIKMPSLDKIFVISVSPARIYLFDQKGSLVWVKSFGPKAPANLSITVP
jgi:WD40 repeat protein